MILDINKYLDNIRDLIPQDSAENQVLSDAYRVMTMSAPTTLSESQIRVATLDSIRLQLVNLSYMISNQISATNKKYFSQYHKEFTRYTNLGRPNQTAVDSEVLYKNPELFELKYKIESYENFKSLILSYIRSLDQIRNTCMECWNDNRYNS